MHKTKDLLLIFPLLMLFLLFPIGAGAEPGRIISLGPRLTEQIFDLGAGDRILAATQYCIRPVEAQKLPRIGNVLEINLEKILDLRPDLVMATDLNDAGRLQKLRNLGIRVEWFPQPRNFAEIQTEWLRIGEILGRTDQAKILMEKVSREAERIRRLTEKLTATRAFFQIGANPLFTIPVQSFMQDYLRMAGGANIAADAGIGIYSIEQVLKRNPEVIFIALMGVDGETEKAGWMKFAFLKASQTGRIHLIDPYTSCSPTPLTFVETLKNLAAWLHPEIAGKIHP